MPKKDDKFLRKVKKLFKEAVEFAKVSHTEYKEDVKFAVGNQWSDAAKSNRGARPVITINQLDKYLNQVSNDQRMNRGRIKSRPFEDADRDTSEVINGLMRHIQNNADSDTNDAINFAFYSAIEGGFGYWRIVTKYEDNSFNQEILFEKVPDALSVFYPKCDRSDCTDADHCFVIQEMTKAEFKEKWPKEDISNWETEVIDKDSSMFWVSDKHVIVAEYWEKKEIEKTIFQVQLPEKLIEESPKRIPVPSDQDNIEIPDPVFEDKPKQQTPGEIVVVSEDELTELPPGYEILQERKDTDYQITCYKMTSQKVLEKNAFKGKFIPIIPVFGKQVDSEGKRHYISLIRFAIEPQRLHNYWKSVETEILQKMPKTPVIMAEGQEVGHEKEWAELNIADRAYVTYKPTTLNGQPIGPPRRTDSTVMAPGVMQAIRESGEDIKSTIGMFNASLGERGNEISGKAILARQREGDTAVYHFIDNLNRSLRHAGRIILDLLPYYYDTPRSIRILGDDSEEKIIKINTRHIDEDGKEKLFDLTTGKYDITIDTGPDYATKRVETAENLLEFTKVLPAAQQVAGDLIAKNLDFPESEVFAERLKATIPPEILQRIEMAKDKENAGPEAIAQQQIAQMQQQMQQATQQTEQLAKENQKLQQQIQQQDNTAKIQAAQIAAQADIQVAHIRAQGEIEEERIKNKGEYANQR